MDATWDAGTQPFLRQHKGINADLAAAMPCPFCGGNTLKWSTSEVPIDPGRLELYCDNQMCDARVINIMVLRDGTPETADRPDVRALEAIDTGHYAPAPPRVQSLAEIARDRGLEHAEILKRRTTGRPVIDLRTMADIEQESAEQNP